MEQAVDDVLEDRAIVLAGDAERLHLLRIGLVAGDVLPGEIIQPGDIGRLVVGILEDVLEGIDLGGRDDAVRLRHLGGKRDHCDGEGNLPACFRIALEERPHSLDHAGQHVAGGIGDHADKAIPYGTDEATRRILEHKVILIRQLQGKQGRKWLDDKILMPLIKWRHRIFRCMDFRRPGIEDNPSWSADKFAAPFPCGGLWFRQRAPIETC